jgi:hypothetical protein
VGRRRRLAGQEGPAGSRTGILPAKATMHRRWQSGCPAGPTEGGGTSQCQLPGHSGRLSGGGEALNDAIRLRMIGWGESVCHAKLGAHSGPQGGGELRAPVRRD